MTIITPDNPPNGGVSGVSGGERAATVALQTIQRLHQLGSRLHSPHQADVKFTIDTILRDRQLGEMTSTSTNSAQSRTWTTGQGSRSLFVFSKNNMLRKAAKAIIDWGYPFADNWGFVVVIRIWKKTRNA